MPDKFDPQIEQDNNFPYTTVSQLQDLRSQIDENLNFNDRDIEEYLIEGTNASLELLDSLDLDQILNVAANRIPSLPNVTPDTNTDLFNAAMEPMSGHWTGNFNQQPYNHYWAPVINLDTPIRYSNGERTIFINSYQIAWVGDGYGVNINVEIRDPFTPPIHRTLGYVTHLNPDGSVNYETPHIGFVQNDNTAVQSPSIIWVTPDDLFYERIDQQGNYNITGIPHQQPESSRLDIGLYERPQTG